MLLPEGISVFQVGSCKEQQDMAEAPQPAHLQWPLKPQWGEDRWRLCAASLLPMNLHHGPETADSSGILRSLSDCVHACLPSWSSLNTRKRPRAHEVQPDHLMSCQCYSLHENNRKLLNGICSLQLIACPLLWPV